MMNAELGSTSNAPYLTVSHVVDAYRRYPGEMVTFHTRVDVHQPLSGLIVGIAIPEELRLGDYQVPADHDRAALEVQPDAGEGYLVWNFDGVLSAGTCYEYAVETRVAPTETDLALKSRAVATSESPNGETVSAEETVAVAVPAKGRYLKHLPAIYNDDELMGRFLMLFESFWAPVEKQIDSLPFYFDPQTTPSDLLPWLASWLGMVLDERWSEESRRQLLHSAARLYRKRGTKEGLQEYLAIYTGHKPQIIEHRAYNFRLGPEARLGPGIALGTGNQPHTFSVVFRLPPASSSKDKKIRKKRELERRRIIEGIIESQKPAHTSYTLHIETIGERKRA